MNVAARRDEPRSRADFLLFADFVLPDQILRDGWLAVTGSRILDVGKGQPPAVSVTVRLPGHLVVPGFVDLHLHGLENGHPGSAEGIREMLLAAPRHGVTGLTPALASATHEQYLTFFDNARAAQAQASGGARLLGVHAEGPHINPRMARGMDPAFLRPPNPDEDAELLQRSSGLLKVMTLSPELPGSQALIRALVTHGVTASVGHSAATRAEVHRAVAAGATQVCHWPNALPKPDREPDLPDTAAYCLDEPGLTLEIIPDLVHVPADKILLAREKAGVDRLVAVTDGMRGAGLGAQQRGHTSRFFRMTDGRRYTVDLRRGCRLVGSDVLVGSAITLLEAFQNLVSRLGFSPVEAAKLCSTNPARQISFSGELGRLAPGFLADFAVLTPNLELKATFVGGRQIAGPALLPARR